MDAEAPEKESVAAAVTAMVEAARQRGVRDDDPDGVWVRTLGDLLVRLEHKIDTTRDLPLPEITRALKKAAADALAGAGRAAVSAATWHTRASLAGYAAFLFAVGAVCGWGAGWEMRGQRMTWAGAELQQAFRGGGAGAEFLADVVGSNDLSAIADACRSARFAQDGGAGCTVSVWIKPPPVGGGR